MKGFPEITKVAYTNKAKQCRQSRFDPETGAHYEDKENWIIETDGVALKKILGVDNINMGETVSNDII